MSWTNKIIPVGMGAGIIAASLGANYEVLQGLGEGILLISGSMVLLGSVAWKKIMDKKLEVDDATSILGIFTGATVFLVGLARIIGFGLPELITTNTAIVGAVVGGFVILQGFMTKGKK